MKRSQLKERVAYLQGLARGLRADKGTREAEILTEVLDVMGALVHGLDRLRAQQQELTEYVDAVDQDLADLEEDVHGVRVYQQPDGSVVAEAGTVPGTTHPEAGRFVASECPGCGRTVYFNEDYLDDDQLEITCPDCGEIVWDSDDDYELSDGEAEGEAGAEATGRRDGQGAAAARGDDPLRESWPE